MMNPLKSWTVILAATLAFGSGKLAAQVLNMSHDLVTLGIASQNLTPNNPSLDATPLFHGALLYIQSHAVQTLTVDTGAYYLRSTLQSNPALAVDHFSNLTIDLAGSTIYFNQPILQNGIELSFCSNVTLKNFKIDYVHPPYTHVQLTSVDTANRLLKYQTLPNWPDPATFNSLAGSIEGYWAAIFRNGAIVPGTSRTLLQGPFSNNTLTIQDGFPWAQSATLATLQAGDTVVVTPRGGGPAIQIWQSDGITLSNITIYASAERAVDLFLTSNSVVDSVRVIPRPGPGLISSDADGIHFSQTGQNNHIRNCYVARNLDDALIMDNLYAAVVVSQSGPRQLTVKRELYTNFPNGTRVNFVDRGTTLESTGAVIVSQNPPFSLYPTFQGNVDLTFDRDLPTAAMGSVAATLRCKTSARRLSLPRKTFRSQPWTRPAQSH